jgi:hypothetical protein
MASKYPYTDPDDSMSLQDLALLDEEPIPMAENVCDIPQIALGVSQNMDEHGYCLDCGWHNTCHDY